MSQCDKLCGCGSRCMEEQHRTVGGDALHACSVHWPKPVGGARERITQAALADLFVPYRWGANKPSELGIHPVKTKAGIEWHFWEPDPTVRGGLDCSGAVLHWWRTAGYDLEDQPADALYHNLEAVGIDELRPGDIALYGADDRATHVVLVLDSRGEAVIGANGGGAPGVRESLATYAERMRARHAFVRIEDRRKGGFQYRDDFLGFRKAPVP